MNSNQAGNCFSADTIQTWRRSIFAIRVKEFLQHKVWLIKF